MLHIVPPRYRRIWLVVNRVSNADMTDFNSTDIEPYHKVVIIILLQTVPYTRCYMLDHRTTFRSAS